MDDMTDILEEFITESRESLDELDLVLIELEKNPSDQERLAKVFRVVHTIKGACGFLGLARLEGITHTGENLLSKLRDGVMVLRPEITDTLLAMADALRFILDTLERTGQEGNHDFAALIARLQALEASGDGPAPSSAAPPSEVPSAPPQTPQPANKATTKSPPVPMEQGAAMANITSVTETNIRVDVELLDKLMNQVGELVLARNQILQHTSNCDNNTLLAAIHRLNHITTELQEGVMQTRMQQIGHLWNKMPRMVRDVAAQCGKEVHVEMDGQHTELDKTLLEAIKDPLTHLVRNAIDHGLESPQERQEAGKPAEGTLLLRAYHESGQVNIEISDNGRGMNLARIKSKAIERALATEQQLARMSERELLSLIFLPGFSTASAVTNVSGRGVGMDVVKTNIEKIGGSIDIQSTPGQGTTVKLKVPLTLAIIPALIIRCNNDRYAIPQVNLMELIRLEHDQIAHQMEHLHGTFVYRLRGRLLPLVDLRQVLNLPPRSEHGQALHIVVLQADEQTFGLVVDSIDDTEEIVVKPLAKALKSLGCYAGATIMGDGYVALILDAFGLAQRGGLTQNIGLRQAALDSEAEEEARRKERENNEQLLLFKLSQDERMAIPLAEVSRLEEFAPSRLERVGTRQVVQYRGQLLPLVDLTRVFGGHDPRTDQEPLSVVVYNHRGRNIGVIVGQILDIVEDALDVCLDASRPGIRTTAVVQGRATEIVDIQDVLNISGVAA